MTFQPSGKFPIYMPETIVDTCLVFDGLARAGKMLVAPLVSDLPRVDYAQNISIINNIPTLWRLGQLDGESAAALLRVTAGTCAYEFAIGRHLNTRKDDVFSVRRSLDADEILERAAGGEGKDAIGLYNAEGRIPSFVTHNHLPLADIWFDAFPNVRIIATVRHPVDTCFSWNSRGWGERYGRDPLAFSLVPAVDGEPVPWFALGIADEYLRAGPWDRIVMSVLELMGMYDRALEVMDAGRLEQVAVACFERMAVDPVTELERFAAWLGTTLHPDMAVAMARERVPRTLDINDRREKRREIENNVSPALLDRLMVAAAAYEKQWEIESL